MKPQKPSYESEKPSYVFALAPICFPETPHMFFRPDGTVIETHWLCTMRDVSGLARLAISRLAKSLNFHPAKCMNMI